MARDSRAPSYRTGHEPNKFREKFDMESNERRRFLSDAAILTSVPGAPPNDLTQTLVHARRIAGRGNGGLCRYD